MYIYIDINIYIYILQSTIYTRPDRLRSLRRQCFNTKVGNFTGGQKMSMSFSPLCTGPGPCCSGEGGFLDFFRREKRGE